MNWDLLLGACGIAVAIATVVVTMLRQFRDDARAEGSVDSRVSALETDVIDHEHRIRYLERPDDRRR